MKVGLLGFTTTNLGDDLQGIAASLNLPHVDRLIDREHLADAKFDEPHFTIMQSWFTRQWIRPPSASIDPYYFAFCVGRPKMAWGLWPRHLRRHAPIGARDLETIRRLAGMGVESFWSGCLTLRIGSFLKPVPAEEREGVYFVDLHPDAERFVPEALRERAVRISNEVPPALMADPLARMARVAALSDRLARAEVVVTRRLHTALPCVGFGTPVALFISEIAHDSNINRFAGFEDFVPIRYYGRGVDPKPVDWDRLGGVVIPDELNARWARLGADVAARVGPVDEPRAARLHRRDVVVLANPGLGIETGRVAIDLGMTKVERVPLDWTATTITVELEGYASFERARFPILVQGFKQKPWIEVATVAEAIARQRVSAA
ncbi:MAG: polysaccharide pyruvyl transferase family protein [Siculibacillus sp.]|nr:polysaccharide pyruvyl transferase family protein [Siculibacillus sp.]